MRVLTLHNKFQKPHSSPFLRYECLIYNAIVDNLPHSHLLLLCQDGIPQKPNTHISQPPFHILKYNTTSLPIRSSIIGLSLPRMSSRHPYSQPQAQSSRHFKEISSVPFFSTR